MVEWYLCYNPIRFKDVIKMNENRLIEIETKLAFQEKAIKDLNEVLYEQQKEIQRLSAICDALVKQDRSSSPSPLGSDALSNEKPPHY